MERIPEPELMDDPAQASAYAQADFSEAHEAFVRYFAERFPDVTPRRVLDLGCGPADVAIRFARAHSDCTVAAVDGSAPMLELAEEAVRSAGLRPRFEFHYGRIPAVVLDGRYDVILSNSLLHHLDNPMSLWATARAHAAPGAVLLVMDLLRPATRAAAEQLVAEYARGEPELLRRDFYNSLLAAYRPDEIHTQLAAGGLARLRVEVVSDRHLLVHGELA
jgi:2-polyprenyl-3-methyl-5-hydroxy-6-metoxy-1,4-benzoquinol methylase